MNRKWFEAWFDSKYYHLLYKDRSEQEAAQLANKLLEVLNPPHNSRMLDLGCGRGRFSRFLSTHDYDVTGVDLSVQSIDYATQFEKDNLHFYVHDMRKFFRTNYYDYIFSFFTSFGYFDNEKDDKAVLKAVKNGLRCGGRFVMDFLNPQYVRDHLVAKEEKRVEDMTFYIERRVDEKFVYKTISFEVDKEMYEYTEKVRLFEFTDFERMFHSQQLKIIQTYGDYDLSEFDAQKSRRLIMVAEELLAE